MSNGKELQKNIGFFSVFAIVTRTVVGSGVLFKISNVTKVTGTVEMTLFVWFLSGITTIYAGLTATELVAVTPETGGLIKYIEYTYGDFWGFLSDWAQSFIYSPVDVVALLIVFVMQLINLFHLSIGSLIPIIAASALSIVLMNFLDLKAGGILQSITLVIKLIPIIVVVIFGILWSGDITFSLIPTTGNLGNDFFTAIGSSLLVTMFTCGGWIHAGNTAGEPKNPKHDLPLAISVGIGCIMAMYLLINAILLLALPIELLAGNLNAVLDTSKILFGENGGKIITTGILTSACGTINGYITTGTRVPYTVAERKSLSFSHLFAKLTESGAPWFGTIIWLIIAIIMMSMGVFDAIINVLTSVIWSFYCMLFVAVITLRKHEPNMERPYEVSSYPIIPLVAILIGSFVLINTLFTQFILAIIGILMTALGIPVYYYKKK